MKKNPLVSVCIPVFMAERTLPRLLESLLLQSFDNFEVVIVDDGSEEMFRCTQQDKGCGQQGKNSTEQDKGCAELGSCKKIVKEFSKKAKKLRKTISFSLVVHSKNLGLVEARRSLVLNAKAPYIVFADSDDLFTPKALEVFYKAALDSGADIVHSRAEIYDEDALALCRAAQPATAVSATNEEAGADSETRNIATAQDEVLCRTPNEDFISKRRKKLYKVHLGFLEGREIFESYFVKKEHSGFLWAKLFRKEVLLEAFEHIPSVFCVMAEDVLIYFYASFFAKKYFGIPDFTYLYDMSGGITSKKLIEDLKQWEKVLSVSSVFTILYGMTGNAQGESDAHHFKTGFVLSDDEKKELRNLCFYYVSNNLKQLNEAVIPELRTAARAMMDEWWGKDLVSLVERCKENSKEKS